MLQREFNFNITLVILIMKAWLVKEFFFFEKKKSPAQQIDSDWPHLALMV